MKHKVTIQEVLEDGTTNPEPKFVGTADESVDFNTIVRAVYPVRRKTEGKTTKATTTKK